ncbi:hypothetical protein BDZ97DRAFT_1663049 [Flammula alnicola]|nr:hypothetical protein BDZ97DRAFT_1663049 [Flammula alnicola]
MDSSDSLFHTLPEHIQRLIDEAFTTAINPNSPPGSFKTRKASSDSHAIPHSSYAGGGGFLVEEPSEPTGGGFLVEDEAPEHEEQAPSQISLDLIPSALQRLDLPPDDDEVLSVFKNAASGWSSSSIHPSAELDPQTRYVSRDDWRSVCAVLLESRAHEMDEDRDDSTAQPAQMEVEFAEEEEDADMSEDYVEAQSPHSGRPSSDSENESDDEYQVGGSSSRRGKQAQRKRRVSSGPSRPSVDAGRPTGRQQEACLEAFALFFPDTSPSELPKQKIKVADIQHAAKLLGEKIKAEEMVEMLNMFSTSPDKSMDLSDFTHMMIMAKLA